MLKNILIGLSIIVQFYIEVLACQICSTVKLQQIFLFYYFLSGSYNWYLQIFLKKKQAH